MLIACYRKGTRPRNLHIKGLFGCKVISKFWRDTMVLKNTVVLVIKEVSGCNKFHGFENRSILKTEVFLQFWKIYLGALFSKLSLLACFRRRSSINTTMSWPQAAPTYAWSTPKVQMLPMAHKCPLKFRIYLSALSHCRWTHGLRISSAFMFSPGLKRRIPIPISRAWSQDYQSNF